MAEVIWAEPALNDLDAIADYIALDNPEAARRLVQKIFEHVEHLASHPKLGSKPDELKGWRREKKLKLILAQNPDWADLSREWEEDPGWKLEPDALIRLKRKNSKS